MRLLLCVVLALFMLLPVARADDFVDAYAAVEREAALPFLDGAEPAGLVPQVAESFEPTTPPTPPVITGDLIPDESLGPPSGFPAQIAEPTRVTVPLPPLGELPYAALAEGTNWGSAIMGIRPPMESPMSSRDPNYDPFQNIAGYEEYAHSFIDANSDEDVYRIKARIDAELKRKEYIASTGIYGDLAMLLAKLADPLSFILALVGAYMARRWWHLLLVVLVVAATVETVLSATQITHQWGEGLIIGCLASSIQACVCYLATRRLGRRKARVGVDPPAFESPSGRLAANTRYVAEIAAESAVSSAVSAVALTDKVAGAVAAIKARTAINGVLGRGTSESKLRELRELFEKELITSEEYAAARKSVLERL